MILSRLDLTRTVSNLIESRRLPCLLYLDLKVLIPQNKLVASSNMLRQVETYSSLPTKGEIGKIILIFHQ